MEIKKTGTRPGVPEWAVLVLYTVGIIVTTCFHEPWFDELQAWEIARCAPLYDILFELPHYEGHPPLWHLLLRLFAIAGVPGILTLRIVNTLFCVSAAALLLLCSPLPRSVRCLLPFNYFLFYHYGAISRPYSMMMLAMFLVAMTYPKRDAHSGRFIAALVFLCFTSVYGVVLASGICLEWTFSILSAYHRSGSWRSIWRDARPYWLLVVLAVDVMLLLCLLPAPDCYYAASDNTVTQRLWVGASALFIIPVNAVFGLTVAESSIAVQTTTTAGIAAEWIAGIALFCGMCILTRCNGKLLLFVIPMLMYALFASLVQLSVHHIGIALLYYIFLFWVMLNDGLRIPESVDALRKKLSPILRCLTTGVAYLGFLVIPAVYAGFSVHNEILHAYGPKEIAEFIRENGMEERSFMTTWTTQTAALEAGLDDTIGDETLPVSGTVRIEKQYPLSQGMAMMVSGYLERNIFPYYNGGQQDRLYMPWVMTTPEQNAQIFEEWSEIGLPDFVIEPVYLTEVFRPEQLDGVTYYWVGSFETGRIFKLGYGAVVKHLYIRGDLLEEYPQLKIHTYLDE